MVCDVAVDVGVEVLAALPVIDAAGDHVPEVRNDAGADQQLALGVVVDAPRIAEPVRHDLEHVVGRVIAPDAAVDVDARRPRGCPRETAPSSGRAGPLPAGLRTFERRGEALQPVEPAVGSPVQAVEGLVPIRMPQPGQAHLDVVHRRPCRRGCGRGRTAGWAARRRTRRRSRPRAPAGKAMPSRNTLRLSATPSRSVSSRIRMRLSPAFENPCAARLVVAVLGDPQPAAVVPAERHRLRHHRLGRPGVHLEARRSSSSARRPASGVRNSASRPSRCAIAHSTDVEYCVAAVSPSTRWSARRR